MPEPTTAWLWRPGERRGRRGTISLEDCALRFEAEDGEVIGFHQIEQARRQRGTPVLEVRYRREGERRIALVFFVRPPDLDETASIRGPLDFLGGRSMRRAGEMGRMRRANRRLKPLVEEWARSLEP